MNYTEVSNTHNAGYSMYVALLGRPQYAYYSPNFQASMVKIHSAWTNGGTNMAPGTYGSTSSSATNQDSHFSGTGTGTVKNVNEPPPSGVLHERPQPGRGDGAAVDGQALNVHPTN